MNGHVSCKRTSKWQTLCFRMFSDYNGDKLTVSVFTLSYSCVFFRSPAHQFECLLWPLTRTGHVLFHRSLSVGVLSIKLRHFLCVSAKTNSGRRRVKGGLRKEEVINSLPSPSSGIRSGVKSPGLSKMQFHKHPWYPCMCRRHDENCEHVQNINKSALVWWRWKNVLRITDVTYLCFPDFHVPF